MRKILLIDNGSSSVHTFKKSLANKGYTLINEQSIKNTLSYLTNGSIDLIAFDHDYASSVRKSSKFRELTADIPRIILTHPPVLQDKNLWLKDGLTVPIREPVSYREFLYWLKRLRERKSMEHDNQLLQAKLQAKEKELSFIHAITQINTRTSDIKKSLIAIMEQAKTMTGATAFSLLLNDEDIVEMLPFKRTKKISRFMHKKGDGITGWVLDKGIPLNMRDVTGDRRFHKAIDYFSNMKTTSLMCAPLKMGSRVIGVLRLFNKKRGRPFTDEDMHLIMNAASHAAMALERAFLYEKLKSDELTNLFNIRYFNEALEMEIERARRYKSMFSLVFMDIDNFKDINDRYGHLVGSRVLVEIAQLLQNNLRKIDVLSRYGGDEFVIILPQAPRKSCFHVAERLRKIIEKNIFLKQEGYTVRLTASLGIASFPENARNKEDLIKLADSAMYRGKFLTKNMVFEAQ